MQIKLVGAAVAGAGLVGLVYANQAGKPVPGPGPFKVRTENITGHSAGKRDRDYTTLQCNILDDRRRLR